MAIRPATRIKYRKVLTILLAWLFIAFIISLYDHHFLLSGLSAGPSSAYSFLSNFIFNASAAFVSGLSGGIFLVFYVNEKLRDKPYGYTLLAVGIAFFILVTIVTFSFGLVVVKIHNGNWPFSSPDASIAYANYLSNPLHTKNILVWLFVTILTQFTLQMDDKFGSGMLWNFIRGKYQTPQKESRVFMFLDLKGSTSIAEDLGNDDYYRFLKDFFSDITKSIVDNSGKIYQYVGDEVVISWTTESAAWQGQCLHCFFDAQDQIERLSDKYMRKFGHVPRFKASLHNGEVTAGEIGIIKRDITYSGDVLNTAARIIAKCNTYGKNLLISGSTRDLLKDSDFEFHHLGDIELRGKSSKTEIYAVKLG